MKAISFSLARTVGLCAGAMLVLASARAAESDSFPTFENNYIKISASGSTFDGSKAAAQARTQQAKSGVAGIEDFRFTYDLEKDQNLQIDGRVMPSNGDYLAQFRLTKNEFGSLEAGYKRFRTFYDGAGGFFPTNNAWLPIYRRPLFVDRGKFFVNATLAMPNLPVFTFKYANETRTGRKDSTIWGDSDLTGIPIMVGPGASNPISANRKILPAYIQLGERLETWEASLRHVIGNTTVVATVAGDRINNRDWRSIDRYVGELKPYPAFSSTTLTVAPQNVTQNPNRGVDLQAFRENGISFGGRVETAFNDKVTLFAGVNYRYAKIGIDASRLVTATINAVNGTYDLIGGFNAPGGRPPYSYTSNGNLKQDIVTGNIGVQTKPLPNLGIDVALKAEHYKDSGHNDAVYVNNRITLNSGAVVAMPVATPQDLSNSEKPWTPAVDFRYTGIRTLSLYGSWEYRSVTQDERTTYGALSVNTSAGTVSGPVTPYSDHIKENHSNASLGANWTPAGIFSARAEVFTKDHENRFEGYGESAGEFYVLDYDIYGAKLTAVVKPMPALAFTTRYIVQHGKAATVEAAYPKGDTNDSKRYQLSETVDWNPNKAVYVQANASLVYDSVVSAYPYISGTAKDVLRNADNNYWNGSLIVGSSIDKETDVQLQATYYKADNYDPAQARATLPYGAGMKEYTLTAGVKYKITPKTVATAKVGYIESKNATSGGFSDFSGPLAYLAVEHAF